MAHPNPLTPRAHVSNICPFCGQDLTRRDSSVDAALREYAALGLIEAYRAGTPECRRSIALQMMREHGDADAAREVERVAIENNDLALYLEARSVTMANGARGEHARVELQRVLAIQAEAGEP